MLVDRLFVYGTLRPGFRNHHADLLANRASYLGAGRVPGRLYRVSHYPAMVGAQSADDWVVGDLYGGLTAQLLMQLDRFEGDSYSREEKNVALSDGRSLVAFLYVWVRSVDGLEWIPSGDWNASS